MLGIEQFTEAFSIQRLNRLSLATDNGLNFRVLLREERVHGLKSVRLVRALLQKHALIRVVKLVAGWELTKRSSHVRLTCLHR